MSLPLSVMGGEDGCLIIFSNELFGLGSLTLLALNSLASTGRLWHYLTTAHR